jgi:hypothetical protein
VVTTQTNCHHCACSISIKQVSETLTANQEHTWPNWHVKKICLAEPCIWYTIFLHKNRGNYSQRIARKVSTFATVTETSILLHTVPTFQLENTHNFSRQLISFGQYTCLIFCLKTWLWTHSKVLKFMFNQFGPIQQWPTLESHASELILNIKNTQNKHKRPNKQESLF